MVYVIKKAPGDRFLSGLDARPHVRTIRAREMGLVQPLLDLLSTGDTEEVVSALVGGVKELSGATGAQVFLFDPQWNDLRSLDGVKRFPAGQGIAGLAAEKRTSYVCADASSDPLYVAEIDSAQGEAPRSVLAVPMIEKEELFGVLEAFDKQGPKGKASVFGESDEEALAELASAGAASLARIRKAPPRGLTREFAAAFGAAVDALSFASINHSDRVRQYCLAVGKEMGLPEAELHVLDIAASVHDVGRIELVPQPQEDGTYTDAELQRLKPHVLVAEAILRRIEFSGPLARVPEVALSHHECLDGSGYPRGKSGGELGKLDRVLAVCDAYASHFANRRIPLHRSTHEEAIAYLSGNSGRLFDSDCVDVFLSCRAHDLSPRMFPRVDYSTPLDVTLLGREEETFEAEALDMSEGGLMFISQVELPRNALLKLLIHLPTEKLEALAKVAWTKKEESGTKAGVYFLWHGRVD